MCPLWFWFPLSFVSLDVLPQGTFFCFPVMISTFPSFKILHILMKYWATENTLIGDVLPCSDSIHSSVLCPLRLPSHPQKCWWVMFRFVMQAPGITVKLWFCFWRGTVTGASPRVAFTALVCMWNLKMQTSQLVIYFSFLV